MLLDYLKLYLKMVCVQRPKDNTLNPVVCMQFLFIFTVYHEICKRWFTSTVYAHDNGSSKPSHEFGMNCVVCQVKWESSVPQVSVGGQFGRSAYLWLSPLSTLGDQRLVLVGLVPPAPHQFVSFGTFKSLNVISRYLMDIPFNG